MKRPAQFLRRGLVSVRSRLIATFLLLFSITLAVVAVGVLGMRANQRALDEYEAYVVPEIARVLELSEKVAQLAAVAPGMTMAESSALLHDDTALLQGLLGDIRRLSLDLTDKAGERLALSDELDGIDNDLKRFLVLSGRQRQLKSESQQLRNASEEIGAGIYRRRAEIAQTTPTLLNVWVNTTLGLQAGDRAALGMAESDNEALWLQVAARGEEERQPQIAAALRRLDGGPRSVFLLRREILSTEDQLSYLVALMRSHAEHLSSNAARYVDELRRVAKQRRETMRRVTVSSQSGLWLLAMAGVALALAGMVYVGRVLQKIQSMTRIMARLAAGDTSQRIPSTDRPDEVGELARAFEVFRNNLLEKQQLAHWLEAQRRQQETVFNSMNDGVSVHDAHGCLLAWNPTFVKLLGLPDALRVGMSLNELRRAVPAPARWRAVSRQTATCTAGGETRIASSAELHLADQRILEFHSQRLPDGGWVAVCRDLTSRRAVEAELRQAQKMDVLGQLTGGVAHDFNNFLVAILGNLELLLPRLAGQPELQSMAERARRAAERASRLTRRLLAFARRQPLQAEAISVAAMLAEMLDLIEYAAGPNIAVSLAAADDELWVHVDRGQLENAILNLSLNSAAAMPDGGTLTLAAHRVAIPERLPGVARAVVLSVSDTGTGIPPMLLDKVTEPFFTTKAPGEGSGLGLSSVYGFVRQSGGDMQIHSTVGLGTRVELWLPAAQAPDLPAPLAPPLATPALPPGARVLVVEDDPEVRDTTLGQLAALGVSAHAVASCTDALAWLAAHGPVLLVLSDISLGAGGNGIALAAKVRRRWPGQRVVLTSGLPLEAHQAHPDWLPEQPFLAKPFDLAALSGLLA